jgi:flavin-binding protein dodecin
LVIDKNYKIYLIMGILKVIEILSSSKESWEDATENAVQKASKSVDDVKSAFVQSQSVTVKDGKVDEYRVNLKVTFEVH